MQKDIWKTCEKTWPPCPLFGCLFQDMTKICSTCSNQLLSWKDILQCLWSSISARSFPLLANIRNIISTDLQTPGSRLCEDQCVSGGKIKSNLHHRHILYFRICCWYYDHDSRLNVYESCSCFFRLLSSSTRLCTARLRQSASGSPSATSVVNNTKNDY